MRVSKRSSIILVACVILFTGPLSSALHRRGEMPPDRPAAPEDLKKDWKFTKPVRCPEDRNTYKYFSLDAEVYRHAAGNLSDLRVADEMGGGLPYFVESGSTEYTSMEVRYASKDIGRSVDQKRKRAAYDFQMLPQKKAAAGNRLVLTVPQEGYSKQVVVYGRRANTDWEVIRKDSIYRFETYIKNEIEFDSDVDFPFYRIEVLDAVPAITVTKLVLVGQTSSVTRRLYQKKNAEFNVRQKGTSTLVEIKNPDRVKVFHITFRIDGTFNRKCELFREAEVESHERGRQGKSRVERTILTTSLYNFNFKDIAVSSTSINLSHDPQRDAALFLRIHNNSDRPLGISEITVMYYIDRVVFKGVPGASYRLYFGNDSVRRPVYDIETYRDHVLKEKMDECALGPLKSKASKLEEGELLSAGAQKIILTVTIVLVSLLLIVFLVKKMSGIKT